MICGRQGAANQLRQRVAENAAYFRDSLRDFFFRPRGGGLGLPGFQPVGLGIGADGSIVQVPGGRVPEWEINVWKPGPDHQPRKPEITRFDGIGFGIAGYEVIKSTHRTVTTEAYWRAEPQFDKKMAHLFLLEYLQKYCEAPDKNDITDNNKGHFLNSHEAMAGRDPGDALKRVRACARALDLAKKGPRWVPIAIKKLKKGALANFAEEIEKEIYGEPFLPRMPERLTPIGKGAFCIYWLKEFFSNIKLYFQNRADDPKRAQAIAVSMIAGQMLHYIQDILSIWHTVAHKRENGKWVVDYPLEHFSFELEAARKDAAGELVIKASKKPESLFRRERSMHHSIYADAAKAVLTHISHKPGPKENWVDALVFAVLEQAIFARQRADEMIRAKEEGKEIVNDAIIGRTVNRAVDFSADVLVTIANSKSAADSRTGNPLEEPALFSNAPNSHSF